MKSYKDRVRVDGQISLRDLEAVINKLREYGTADFNLNNETITFSFEEEDDWDLREVLAEVEQELASYGVYINISKDNMETRN